MALSHAKDRRSDAPRVGDTAFDFLGDQRIAELHALAPVRSRLSLPSDALSIGRKTLAAGDSHDVARPIDFDERDLLLVEPGQHIEGDAAAAVEHYDPRRQVRVAFEEAVGFLFLRIVGEAVAYEECSGL